MPPWFLGTLLMTATFWQKWKLSGLFSKGGRKVIKRSKYNLSKQNHKNIPVREGKIFLLTAISKTFLKEETPGGGHSIQTRNLLKVLFCVSFFISLFLRTIPPIHGNSLTSWIGFEMSQKVGKVDPNNAKYSIHLHSLKKGGWILKKQAKMRKRLFLFLTTGGYSFCAAVTIDFKHKLRAKLYLSAVIKLL